MKKRYAIYYLKTSFFFILITFFLSVAGYSKNYYTNAEAQKYREKPKHYLSQTVPKEIRNQVYAFPEKNLGLLVNYLIQDASNDFLKVKIIHDWITENISYDEEVFFRRKHVKDSAETTLQKQKAVCDGFAKLFQAMCKSAGIETLYITGITKGYGYSQNGYLGLHAWNAVKIQNSWYLVDITWDAGYINGQHFIKQYSTDYLFLSPQAFIYTHFPTDDRHQFLNKPITKEKFVSLPYLQGKFFRYNLRLLTPHIKNTIRINGTFKLEIECPDEVLLFNRITVDGQEYEGYSFLQRINNKAILYFSAPVKGLVKAEIYAKSILEKGNKYENVA